VCAGGGQYMSRVECPVLFIAGERDTIAPMEGVMEAFQKAQHGALITRDTNHFEIYMGQHFEEVRCLR
jgi:uncharacterized protein